MNMKKKFKWALKKGSNNCWNYELTQSFRCSYSDDDDTSLMVMTTKESNPMIRGQK